MPGVLSHLIAAVFCFSIVHMIHLKWEFSWAIFAGNFLPDVLRQGFTALKQGTLAVLSVEQDSFYKFMSKLTSSYANWLTLGFFVFGATALLYHFHYIQKKKWKSMMNCLFFF